MTNATPTPRRLGQFFPRPRRRIWRDWNKGEKGAVVALAVLVPLAAIGAAVSPKTDDSGRRMTLTEAACGMLRDGEDVEFTYEVSKDLAAQHEYTFGDPALAARLAVDQAVAQGC